MTVAVPIKAMTANHKSIKKIKPSIPPEIKKYKKTNGEVGGNNNDIIIAIVRDILSKTPSI